MAFIRNCGPDWLDAKLTAGEILVIDGAMGTELEARGVPMHDDTWRAAATKTHPDIVRKVHADHIRAGAPVIAANTFSSGRHVPDRSRFRQRDRGCFGNWYDWASAASGIPIPGGLSPSTIRIWILRVWRQFVDVIDPEDLVREARAWAGRGVQLLGGCCGLGPRHISALKQAFA